MKLNIAVLDGDGIGPEICRGAVTVLERVGEKFGHEFEFKHYPIGGCAIDECGDPLPEKTVEGCLNSDSVLLGAVGGYKWDDLPGDMRPEKGLLRIRRAMGLYSNIRPAKLWKGLANASPLKHELVKDGIEIIIVRELTGGIYFGERGRGSDENGDSYEIEEPDEALRRWGALWNEGSFPEIPVRRYLEEQRGRFWLFDTERPFFQVPGIAGTDYTAAKLNGALSESGNKTRLFPPCAGEGKGALQRHAQRPRRQHVNFHQRLPPGIIRAQGAVPLPLRRQIRKKRIRQAGVLFQPDLLPHFLRKALLPQGRIMRRQTGQRQDKRAGTAGQRVRKVRKLLCKIITKIPLSC